MDFLRECAASLDEGVPAEVVMAKMRERYTTASCLNVKTCVVRQMCAPSPAYTSACETLLRLESDVNARAVLEEAFRTGRSADPRIRAKLATLPHRLPDNVYALRVTRAEMRECKRLSSRTRLEKNRKRRRVGGRALLSEARATLADPTTVVDLAMALMLVTGRRTCEVLNGQSSLEVVDEYTLLFGGQAKRRGCADAYLIPCLVPSREVVRAFEVLRTKQGHVVLTNRETSLRYQSPLSQRLRKKEDAWSDVGCVHGLRGVYACMALRLFTWEGDESDAFVAMCILGHRDLHESLVYTPFHLGDDFGDEPRLGRGRLTAPAPPETPPEPPATLSSRSPSAPTPPSSEPEGCPGSE